MYKNATYRLNFIVLNLINYLKKDEIGEPPWGGFSVEWSRALASELEVTGNPLKRLKNAIGKNLPEVYYEHF